MQAGTAHWPLGHILHSVPKLEHSSAYLQYELVLPQVSLHWLLKQPNLAQLPSSHGVQLGGGVPQSEVLMHLAAPQVKEPKGAQAPSLSQNVAFHSAHPLASHTWHGKPHETPMQLVGVPHAGFEARQTPIWQLLIAQCCPSSQVMQPISRMTHSSSEAHVAGQPAGFDMQAPFTQKLSQA